MSVGDAADGSSRKERTVVSESRVGGRGSEGRKCLMGRTWQLGRRRQNGLELAIGPDIAERLNGSKTPNGLEVAIGSEAGT